MSVLQLKANIPRCEGGTVFVPKHKNIENKPTCWQVVNKYQVSTSKIQSAGEQIFSSENNGHVSLLLGFV
jgi:hypothetical protein